MYDPDCGFCTRTATWLKRRSRCAVRPLSPAAVMAHGLDAERCRREVPFVDADGRTSWGAAAIAGALRTCSLPWCWVGWALAGRVGQGLARPVYRWVADHRHELPGGTAACELR
ncbi:thiol-disulfide oxidoreductase DCC family protein [Propionibacteriaceae bacterium Y1923]